MTTRIVADVMIPGRGDPVADATVVFDEAGISYAGPTAAAPSQADETVHEVATVMPGLWDCHAHYMGLQAPNIESLVHADPLTRMARATADAKRTLMAGVTSVRELGGVGLEMMPAIADGSIQGPNIHAAGRALSTTGGHADIHSIPPDWMHTHEAHINFGSVCDGVPEVLRATRSNLRRNAKVIKVCASGGVMSEVDHPIHQQFSDEELRAIVEEARRAERTVAAHCHGKPGIMAALRAGVKTIEHGSYLDEESAELMAEQGAILVPTRYIVDELLQAEAAMPAYAYEKLVMVADHHEQAIKIAIASGVRLATGCDIFLSGARHGTNSREIVHLVNSGLTDLEAIEAATATAAETLGPQAPQAGILTSGYDADVIALDANPLDDRSIWGDPDRITHVWKGGSLEKAPG